MVQIPAGSFLMGSPDTEQDRFTQEGPQRTVSVSGFWMGRYEVTQAQWKAVMGGANPSYYQGAAYGNTDKRPVEQVSWNMAHTFVDTLNAYIGSTGQGSATMRLPSEAEWEYACRAGSTTRFYWGNDPLYTELNIYAWTYTNDLWRTHDVGTAGTTGHPNPWGLYDMSGNVAEMCEDDYHSSYIGAPSNGNPWLDSPRNTYRVYRTLAVFYGHYTPYVSYYRSAYRANYSLKATDTYDYLGFRLAR
jgi:formylglycine-generating enzyme required for sulfatase activity